MRNLHLRTTHDDIRCQQHNGPWTKIYKTDTNHRTKSKQQHKDSQHVNRTDDTDSAYNTEPESNHTECLPRPSKSQQITNTKCNQGTKPSCIRIPNHTKSNSKTSHLSTLTHQTKPKMPTASTYHQCIRKTPLLPTPPSPVRNFNYSSHYKQYTTRPWAFNNRNPAFTRPSPFHNRFNQQPILTGPYQQHQQTQGHFFTRTLSAATATWTLSTASIQHIYFSTISTTILHRMKIEDTGFYKDISV